MTFMGLPYEKRVEIARKGGLAPHKKPAPKTVCNHGHKLVGDNRRVAVRQRYSVTEGKIVKYETVVCRECVRISARKSALTYRRKHRRKFIDEA